MSNSLSPWILEFLLDIGKEFGAKLYNVQPYQKKKKVQITEFLTYPGENEDDTPIWARISDKKHIAVVKFSKNAVRMFKEMSTTRLTQNKGAIVSISAFKPISSRFPLEPGRMSTEAFIVFDCDLVSLIGSRGAPTFGQPKGIEQERDIDLWSKGLAQDGGAGNILKEGEGKKPKDVTVLPPMPTPPTPQVLPAPAPRTSIRAPSSKPIVRRVDDGDLSSYKSKWQFLEKGRQPFMAFNHQETIPTSPTQSEMRSPESDHQEKQRRSRSGTPITDWNSSPQNDNKSAMQVDNDEDEKGEDLEFEDLEPEADRSEMKDKLSSSLPAPTPAQRVKKPACSTPGPSSSYHLGNETQMSPRTRQQRSTMSRKVPRPASPEPQPAEQTGPGQVLVPNSDTSQRTYSQPSQAKQATASDRTVFLGGLVKDTSPPFPWMSISDIAHIWRTVSELRLHNDRN